MSETPLHTLGMLAERFKRYGLSGTWLKAEAEAGRIPCLRAGRRMLFDAEAVEAVLIRRAAQQSKGAAMSELSRRLLRKDDAGELPRLALRPREAARALGIGERLLWSLTKRGELPHLRLGNKCIVYPVDALRDWLAEQVQQNGGRP